MPKHRLKLLILLTAFAVAPASAGHRGPMISPTPAVASWSDDWVACPKERARLAAARQAAAAKSGPTTITLTDRVPADAPLLGRGSAFINP
jgi:uncharacterized membrane-anchored protein